MFKEITQFASMMRSAQALKDRMGDVQEKMKDVQVVGTASDGPCLVAIEMNGMHQATACRIDDRLLDPAKKDVLQQLIVEAMNNAQEKSRGAMAKMVADTVGSGADLQGIQDAMKKMGMG